MADFGNITLSVFFNFLLYKLYPDDKKHMKERIIPFGAVDRQLSAYVHSMNRFYLHEVFMETYSMYVCNSNIFNDIVGKHY